MKEYFFTSIGRFRLVAFLEGVSFVTLVGVAMPLKYLWNEPWLVQNIGLVHGLLFVSYVLMVIRHKFELGWHTGRTVVAIVASFLPFGTFYVMARMMPLKEKHKKGLS